MDTRDQRIATTVYTQMMGLEKKSHQKYGSMCHKLPVLIRTAGLVQALMFVQARGENAHATLLEHLAKTIDKENAETLLASSRTAPLIDYMYLTKQVLDALLWYKRFAQSVLNIQAGMDDEGGTP